VTGSFTGTGGSCTAGGVTVEVEGNASSKKFVCNGTNGSGGGGEPELPNFLPAEQSETGTWAIASGESAEEAGGGREEKEFAVDPISFNIPLESQVTGQEILKEGQTGPHCHGSEATPTADPGFLCFYTGVAFGAAPESLYEPGGLTASVNTGAGVVLAGRVEPRTFAWGTWAVTAPEEP
jgi:hypothetical protein